MIRIKNFLPAVLAAVIILSLVSCSESLPEKTDGGITVTDQAGRSVTLSEPAEKVVSCYYVTTYSMLSLGLGDKLVGIENKADKRPIYRMVDGELTNLPAVGSLKELDIEKIVSLAPELVLLPKKLADSAGTLEAFGINALVVDPETDEGLTEMLKLIGTACGADEKTDALIEYRDGKLAGFEAPAEKPSVLFLGNSSFLTAAPSGMYQNVLIELAGGVNAYGETEGNYWNDISYETLRALNPDVIIAPSGASYTADDIKNDPILRELDAVKNGRLYFMPGTFEEWDSPVPSGFLGVLWLRAILYPQTYDIDSFRKDVSDFYETFYGFTPTSEELDTLG